MKIFAVCLLLMNWMLVSTVSLAEAPSVPIDFAKFERDVFSQSGEDGVIEKIFEVIQPTTHYAVEFGAQDGIKNSNTRRLILQEGWSSLQIEGDPRRAKALAKNFADHPRVTPKSRWLQTTRASATAKRAQVALAKWGEEAKGDSVGSSGFSGRSLATGCAVDIILFRGTPADD